MTLFDVEELTAYWAVHPPLHILVGAYLSVGKEKRKQVSPIPTGPGRTTRLHPETLLPELGPGFGVGDVHAGLAPVVLDFAELRRRSRARD
jgi:hypothetical protein